MADIIKIWCEGCQANIEIEDDSKKLWEHFNSHKIYDE